jgi:hypothetical protein
MNSILCKKYDAIGQLKVADSSTNSADRGYTYDASWNLRYRTNNGSLQTFSVDGENQLTSGPDGDCVYDENGNLISAQGGLQVFAYDAENQLVRLDTWATLYPVPVPDKRTFFTYDGMNRLRLREEWEWRTGGAEEAATQSQGQEGDSGGQTQSPPGGGDSTWWLVEQRTYIYDGRRVIYPMR